MNKRDFYRGNRGVQHFRAHRQRGREIAIACQANPKLAEAFQAARKQGHDRDRAFKIACASIAAAQDAAQVAERRAVYQALPISERETVRQALVRNQGNRTRTAAELGVSPTTLRRRMKRLSLV